MVIGGNNYLITLLFVVIAFQACHRQKKIVDDSKKENSTSNHVTLPGSVAMSPGTFGAEAEVLSVTTILDPVSGGEYYKANILIHAITGRGSSLIEIVSAGDTINCAWPTYHPDDNTLASTIANKKLMEMIIAEFPGKSAENHSSLIIRSYRLK